MSEHQPKSKLPPIEMRALRQREQGIFERLLCQLLIRANASDGLKKIDLMCQAYHRTKPLLPQNPILITEDEVDIIHKVVTGLKYATHYSMNGNREYIQVPWPFPPFKENFDRYISPWVDDMAIQFYAYIGDGVNYQELEEQFKQYLHTLPIHQYFFCITMGQEQWGAKLSEAGFDHVCSQFVIWALPKVNSWYIELAKLVDETIFDSILKTMYGPPKEEEEK